MLLDMDDAYGWSSIFAYSSCAAAVRYRITATTSSFIFFVMHPVWECFEFFIYCVSMLHSFSPFPSFSSLCALVCISILYLKPPPLLDYRVLATLSSLTYSIVSVKVKSFPLTICNGRTHEHSHEILIL